jgi:hypothetical protein
MRTVEDGLKFDAAGFYYFLDVPLLELYAKVGDGMKG